MTMRWILEFVWFNPRHMQQIVQVKYRCGMMVIVSLDLSRVSYLYRGVRGTPL